MNIEANPTVATSARTRRTVLSVAIAVIATIPIAAGSSGASDEPTSPDTTESTVPTTGSLEATADTLEPTTGSYHRRGRSPHVHRSRRLGEQRLVREQVELRPRSSARSSSLWPTSSPIPANGWRSTHPPVPPSMTSSQRSPACPPSTPPRRPMSPSTGSTESRSSSPSPTTTRTNAETAGSACSKIQALLGRVPTTGPKAPTPAPSTVDPRHRRHPLRDRRDVLPGHLPAGPRRPRHAPQLHPNRRPRRDRAVQRRRSGRNVRSVLHLICVRRSSTHRVGVADGTGRRATTRAQQIPRSGVAGLSVTRSRSTD